jgi:hypothetical protein
MTSKKALITVPNVASFIVGQRRSDNLFDALSSGRILHSSHRQRDLGKTIKVNNSNEHIIV